MIHRFQRLFPAGYVLVVALWLLPCLVGTAGAYTCSMDGPAVMAEGTRALYSVGVDNTVLEVNWTIAGHGVITTRTQATAVIVESGTPGSIELVAHVTLAAGGNVVDCSRTVEVRELDCTISGDTEALEHGLLRHHRIPTPPPGVTIQWRISGNGALTMPTNSEQAVVVPGEIGQYVVSVTLTSETHITSTCSLAVPVAYNPYLPHPNRDAKLALHLGVTQARPPCLTASGLPACGRVKSTGLLYPKTYFAHLLVQDANATAGVGGVQLGVDYNASFQAGVDVFSWALCATLEFTSSGPNGPWPAPGSGNLITWDISTKCQRSEPGGPGTGVVASAGFFYLSAYSPDILRLTPRPVDNQAKVASCDALEDVIGGVGGPADPRLGYATFSADERSPGFNPCLGPVTIRPTTWSAIKGQYAR